uniref:Uncharacterized protein n=2 Tax=Amphimedon queenslandica TaxID=400682 RepID=A0A1X7TPZ9_AMPQE
MLHYSIRNGWLDVTRDLVTKYHFNPHIYYYNDESCLYTAAKGNHVDIVEYLIKEYGCEACDPMMGTTSVYGSIPVLHYVASEGLLDVLKCMVMNINGHIMDKKYRDTNGRTVLHYAVEHIDIVKYLINECNCDIMTPDKDGVPLLHYVASSEGLLDVLKCMVMNINGHIMDEHYRDTNGQTVLHCAVEHIDVLNYLINECNCDIMTPDKFENTILHVAASEGSLDVMKYLINTHHCNPMTTNNNGQTVLHVAVKHMHVNVVRYLLNEYNCDIMAADKDSVAFLHYVAREGLLDVLKCMVMNINGHIMDEQYRDTNGWTVLHCAVEHIDVVKYLINECNCDIMTPDKDGNTILHYAASEGSLDVIKYLINTHHYPMTTYSNGQFSAVEHIDVVKYLINECNYDIMVTDKDGVPFLHYVASQGLLDVLKCMVMNINGHIMDEQYHDTNSQTVLHCAVKHIDIVKYLINE